MLLLCDLLCGTKFPFSSLFQKASLAQSFSKTFQLKSHSFFYTPIGQKKLSSNCNPNPRTLKFLNQKIQTSKPKQPAKLNNISKGSKLWALSRFFRNALYIKSQRRCFTFDKAPLFNPSSTETRNLRLYTL